MLCKKVEGAKQNLRLQYKGEAGERGRGAAHPRGRGLAQPLPYSDRASEARMVLK